MHLVEVTNELKHKEIMTEFKKEYWFKISYKTTWRTREDAMKKILGSFEKSFNDDQDYLVELRSSNPCTRMWLVRSEDDCFLHYFWCFGVCIISFRQSLRPLIVIDATYLHKKYLGVLFVVVTQYTHYRLFFSQSHRTTTQ